MKIAVPTRDGRVDDHFGHCAYYTIFNIIDGKVADVTKMASPQGCGCKSGIAPVLKQMGVAVMLAGNMGQGAKNVPQYCLNITPQEELDKLTIPRETVFVFRERGTGRPTKKERREIDALMDGFYYDEDEE